ncbi:unnamed protein product [Rhizoctonia solani]|uniref:Protein kinase domain-containing protein n=1 Tax=Rhizoctonia solani TaxID=456999 RepID=A0A8H2Y3J8_9AGAM|nr:unnamed protein product [Rhizoctonia solani]
MQLDGRTVISRETPTSDFLQRMVARGVRDLTNEINVKSERKFSVASGGFADIYCANLYNGARVAIKVHKIYGDDQDWRYRKTVWRGVYNWSKLRHPNIHEMLGLAMFRGRIGTVSPWEDNGHIRSYLNKEPDADRLHLCVQISTAVSYLHDNGIVHGDIKGMNVLVSKDGIAMLIDFDDAKLGGLSLAFSQVSGLGISLRWAPPELLLNDSHELPSNDSNSKSSKSDIYSLGMTILEVVTAKVPWSGITQSVGVVRAVVEKKVPPRPKEISGDSLWNLLLQCWSFVPGARPTAQYVLEALQNMSPDSIGPLDIEIDARKPQKEPPKLDVPSEVGAVRISRNMPLVDVVSHLTARGCRDLSEHIDDSVFDALPSLGGGSGDIYFGSLLDSTPVCIKVARYTSDIIRREKSQVYASREIHTWNKCNHPNILPFLGLAVFRERIAIVSPWIKNGTMRDFLKENPDTDRCRLFRQSTQICDGIIYLHSLDIVHGDLKGENVLISDDGDALLADFGSADLSNRTISFTQFLDQCGWTMRWGAPELLKEIIPRSKEADVYALGMTILEAITGKSPFAGKKEMAVMLAVCIKQELPARPIDLIPPTSEHGERLWQLLRKCWSHEAESRPSAVEVGSIMKTITKGGLLEAH